MVTDPYFEENGRTIVTLVGGNDCSTDNCKSVEMIKAHEGKKPFPLSKQNWQCQRKWPLYEHRFAFREYLAEFIGTWVFILFGEGVNATRTFVAGKYAGQQSNAGYLGIALGWAFSLTMALFVCMGVSGGHLNPAVTFANCVFGTFPWRKLPGYVLAQFLGAFLGALCMYSLFYDHFNNAKKGLADGETMSSKYGGIFATYPQESNVVCAWSEFLNTTLLLIGIMGILDARMTPAETFKPLAIGLLVFVIGIATGFNSGFAMNAARDLGPRTASALVFKSTEPFTLNKHYFWIPLFFPLIGATFGMFLYVFFIIPTEKSEVAIEELK